METGRLRSPRGVWYLLYIIHVVAIGAGVLVAGYALIPLRTEKMQVIYRAEGVPFAAGPEAVPPDQWRRMSAAQLEIVEPMANWVLGVSAALVALSGLSLSLLIRLSPFAAGGSESRAEPLSRPTDLNQNEDLGAG
jgi:hypothetical protein